jgi:hypothetical protein|tara:strand:- start:384 stop:596 length:213 start_codon:yes stop_codon:yes gene_type:complete
MPTIMTIGPLIILGERRSSGYQPPKQFVVWHNGHFHIWIVPDPPLVVKGIDDNVQVFFRKVQLFAFHGSR